MAFVRAASGTGYGTSPITATLTGSNPVAGNILICKVGNNATVLTLSSISMTGVTWSSITAVDNVNFGQLQVFYSFGANQNASTTTVTVTDAVKNQPLLVEIEEYNDIVTAFDQVNSATGNSTTPSTGSITPTVSNSLAIAAFYYTDGSGNSAPLLSTTNGYTYNADVQRTRNNHIPGTSTNLQGWFISSAYKVLTSTASTSTGGTFSNANSNQWIGAILNFKTTPVSTGSTSLLMGIG